MDASNVEMKGNIDGATITNEWSDFVYAAEIKS